MVNLNKLYQYLGLHGSPESKIAYSRFLAEIQANPTVPPPNGEGNISIRELTAAYLDHAQALLVHRSANMTQRCTLTISWLDGKNSCEIDAIPKWCFPSLDT